MSEQNLTVSHSRIKTARRCWKRHDYRYNERLQRKAKAAPLLRGTILHEMLDAYAENTKKRKNQRDPYDITKRYAKEYRQMFRELREEYGDTFIQDIDRIFAGYLRTYAKDPLKYELSEVENRIEIIEGVEFIYVIDKIATDAEGRRWLMDHKTAKNIPNEEARFSDIQLVFYVWAWNEQHEEDEQIDGIIWDYVRTKPPTIPEVLKSGQLSQAKSIATDYYTYYTTLTNLGLDARLYYNFLEELKSRGTSDFYQRIRLPTPSKAVVKSVVRDARETTEQIMEFGATLKARTLTKECAWDCDFYQLCHAELRGLDSEFVRKTQYEVRDDRKESDETKHSG